MESFRTLDFQEIKKVMYFQLETLREGRVLLPLVRLVEQEEAMADLQEVVQVTLLDLAQKEHQVRVQDLLHSIGKLSDKQDVKTVQQMQEQLQTEFVMFKVRNNVD